MTNGRTRENYENSFLTRNGGASYQNRGDRWSSRLGVRENGFTVKHVQSAMPEEQTGEGIFKEHRAQEIEFIRYSGHGLLLLFRDFTTLGRKENSNI